MLKRLVTVSAVLFFSTTAQADQCAWNTEAQAQAGAAQLKASKEMVSFCAPCRGGKAEHLQLKDAAVTAVSNGRYHEVTVFLASGGSRKIDLAYTYVPDGSGNFRNLASLVGCPVHRVPLRISKDGQAITTTTSESN